MRRRKRKSRLVAAEFIGILTVTAVVFIKARAYAGAWRGYDAMGGEFMLLLLPIIYYLLKQTIRDYVRDFVELYENAPED